VVFEIAPDRLIGDKIALQFIDINAIAFEAALDAG